MNLSRLLCLWTLFLFFFVPGTCLAYQLTGEEWAAGEAAFHVNFSPQFQTLVTDNEVWNGAFRNAMTKWTNTNQFLFSEASTTAIDPCTQPDPPENSSSFTLLLCDDTGWGESTIALAYTFFDTVGDKNLIRQGGVIFNDAVLWDVYDEPWGVGAHCFDHDSNPGTPCAPVGDFRRVAVHELGHIIGLGHPLVDPGSCPTPSETCVIMRDSQEVGDTVVDLQADDIAGAAAIYDLDADGYGIALDNCPLVANADQADGDSDGLGDVCDTGIDTDGDGVEDSSDNCPLVANNDQANLDGDGLGDVCDPDDDGDTVADGSDNCPLVANPDQLDTDTDGQGNACDTDDDNDGVLDGVDAFPLDATESADTDSDGVGNNGDNCPLAANPDQMDGDSDGVGDVCDAGTDTDGDGVDNSIDNCPLVANPDQLDTDTDGQGNVCDTDDDNDGVLDGVDAFPLDASESMDTDGDGIGDNSDNCKLVDNSDQLDSNGDGTGNACEEDDGFIILLPVIKKALE